MKVRNGFVSNSSSSSFLIYGISMDFDVIKEQLKKLEQFKEENEEDMDVVEILDELFKGKKIEVIGNYNEDDVFIGRSWDSVEDEETGLQFKEDVKKKITEVLGEVKEKFNTYEEAWYG